jgi:hypothetical protein
VTLQLINKKIPQLYWIIALLVALGADGIDYALIGAIPLYGDIFDIIVMGILFRLIGYIALAGIIELIPVGGDFVPTYALIVIIAWLYTGSKRALR